MSPSADKIIPYLGYPYRTAIVSEHRLTIVEKLKMGNWRYNRENKVFLLGFPAKFKLYEDQLYVRIWWLLFEPVNISNEEKADLWKYLLNRYRDKQVEKARRVREKAEKRAQHIRKATNKAVENALRGL